MTRTFTKIGRAFRALGFSEKGSATVEFVIVFPFFVGVFLSAYEVAIMNLRAVMIERATDMVVRELRLGGGKNYDPKLVKAAICLNTMLIPDCYSATKIELTPVDKDTWSGISADVDCADRTDPIIRPPKNFSNGAENEFMLIRVCAVVDPIFATFGVGRSIPKDDSGGYQIIASSAFVNEPDS